MCGIAGIWLKGRREDAVAAVDRGLSAMIHRGPDDRGLVEILPGERRGHDSGVSGTLAFGLQRLAIIDLSPAGHQPMRDAETGNWITYNGEIYNFRELRAELEQHGCRFRSHTDSEVALLSYRVWGKDCVRRWRGMFAAAIWDEREQELFLVRDRLGVKPLYYCRKPEVRSQKSEGFAFASEVRALLAMRVVEPRLDLAAIDTFLMFGAVQDPLTMVEGVRSLPPAHTLTVKDGAARLREYWEMPLGIHRQGETPEAPSSETEAEAKGESAQRVRRRIAERLDEAVRLRLISDVPLGVFLSGGIDSSAVAMLAQRQHERATANVAADQIKTFTIGFDEEQFDETRQASETARRLGVEHHRIVVTEDEMLSSYGQAIEALDQPSIDGVNTWFISRAVKQAGMTVALSGLGGDELFAGYQHFRSLPRLDPWLRGWARAPFAIRNAAAGLIPNGTQQRAKLSALVSGDYGFGHPYFLSRSLFLPGAIADLLEPEAVREIDYGAWAGRIGQIQERAARLDPVNRISYFELKTYLANTLLRDADVMSMAHSLEVRVPLLDHPLIEDVMRLPGRMKLQGNAKKPLLVDSLPRRLPPAVTEGQKRGFVLPFEKWLRGALRERVEASFASPPAGLQGVINTERAADVWRGFLAGRYSWTRPWALFVLYEVVERTLSGREVLATDKHGSARINSN